MSAPQTLHETLETLGWRSYEAPTAHKSGRIVRCSGGHDLGNMTAAETWAELRARGLIPGNQPDPLRRFLCHCLEEDA